jgi:lipoprotein NlpD
MKNFNRYLCWTLVAGALTLSGCAGRSLNRAPVEDRNAPTVAAPELAPPKLVPGLENAGRPGFYTVKPGDTLTRIALDTGQSPQDVVRWNHIENPNRIEVGQVLRVMSPSDGEVVVKPVTKPSVTTTTTAPVASSPVATPAPAESATSAAARSQAAEVAASAAARAQAAEGNISWLWPATGAVLTSFDEVKNKGVDIGGAAGDPVLAAADGRVVYVGAGLRGYGNLIILKHDNVFLTAYAHNRSLLVKEDQSVLKGQKIAEMGSSDTDRVKLHFEVRRQGKPVDPVKYLPAR